MNIMAIVSLALVGVGVILILLGAWMSLRDWKRKHEAEMDAKPDSLEGTLKGLAQLLEALKPYPASQRLIVFGIVVLIVAGLFGGISGL
jgi:hypothetical protein